MRQSKSEKVTIRCIGHSLGKCFFAVDAKSKLKPGGALAMMNAADLTHNSGVDEWDTEADVTCCTFGAPAAGNKGEGSVIKVSWN